MHLLKLRILLLTYMYSETCRPTKFQLVKLNTRKEIRQPSVTDLTHCAYAS